MSRPLVMKVEKAPSSTGQQPPTSGAVPVPKAMTRAPSSVSSGGGSPSKPSHIASASAAISNSPHARSISNNVSKPTIVTKAPAPVPQQVYQSTSVTLTLPPKSATTQSVVSSSAANNSAPVPSAVSTKAASSYLPSPAASTHSSPLPNTKNKMNSRASGDGTIAAGSASPKIPPKPQDLNDRFNSGSASAQKHSLAEGKELPSKPLPSVPPISSSSPNLQRTSAKSSQAQAPPSTSSTITSSIASGHPTGPLHRKGLSTDMTSRASIAPKPHSSSSPAVAPAVSPASVPKPVVHHQQSSSHSHSPVVKKASAVNTGHPVIRCTTGSQFIRHLKEVCDWMETLTNDPPLPHSPPQRFLDSLQSGITLCRVMQLIDERAIPRIHYNNNPLKISENLTNFLEACRDMGVPDLNLFKISDFKTGNVVSVVECIYALAKVSEENGFRVRLKSLPESTPLPPDLVKIGDALVVKLHRKELPKLPPQASSGSQLITPTSSSSTLNSASSPQTAQQYQHQQHSTPLPTPPTKNASSQKPTQATPSTSLSGNGNSISASRKAELTSKAKSIERSIVKFQAVVRGRLQRQQYLKRRRDLAYRDRVAQEIVSTEQQYVNSLQVLQKYFHRPLLEALEADKAILNRDEIKAIFGDIFLI